MQRRSLVWNDELALVLCALAAGCDDAASPVHVVDLDDGTYLRGAQVSKLEIAPGHEVVRSELYLDGLRVAADDLAPFELVWDTRSFDDGRHTLVARVYLVDDSYLDGKTAMWIDNTPPEIGALPRSAMRGMSFTVPATDNLKLSRVEISRGVEGEAPVVVTAEPLTFSWPWACGSTAIHVRAFDAAGGEVTADTSVIGADPDDRDCDGFRAQSRGGNDCDDDNVSAHPGAMEVPEGYDLDCDGRVASLPSFDFDGDGVASIADGGNDCNDSDPAVHGPSYSFKHVPITRDGLPLTWNAGEAELTGYGSNWNLYLNRDGIIEQYRFDFDGTLRRTELATGANAGSISISYIDRLAFGSGNQIKILAGDRGQGSWASLATIPASGSVGKLAITHDDDGDYLAFQVGTQLFFATSSGSMWTTELVADVGASIQEIVSVSHYQGFASIVIRSNDTQLLYTRNTLRDPFMRSLYPVPEPSAYVSYYAQGTYPSFPVSARIDGNGSMLYNVTSSAPLLHTPRRIAVLVSLGEGSLLVKYADRGLPQVVNVNASGTTAHLVQNLASMEDIDLVPWRISENTVFLGQGVVHYLASVTTAAQDPVNDGVDRDCDKLD